MPEPGEKVVFNETNKCIKHPLVIYADFESILEKTDDIYIFFNQSISLVGFVITLNHL